jgi:hypothetical protein
MKTEPNALGTAEKDSGRAKQQNGTRRPRYRRKNVRERKTLGREGTPSVSPKMSHDAQNKKTGPEALVPPKTSMGAQNMNMGPDDLGTVENESGRAKHENGSRRPRYRKKGVRARKTRKWVPTPSKLSKMSPGGQNKKTRPDALGTAENDSGVRNMKTGRPRYSRK